MPLGEHEQTSRPVTAIKEHQVKSHQKLLTLATHFYKQTKPAVDKIHKSVSKTVVLNLNHSTEIRCIPTVVRSNGGQELRYQVEISKKDLQFNFDPNLTQEEAENTYKEKIRSAFGSDAKNIIKALRDIRPGGLDNFEWPKVKIPGFDFNQAFYYKNYKFVFDPQKGLESYREFIEDAFKPVTPQQVQDIFDELAATHPHGIAIIVSPHDKPKKILMEYPAIIAIDSIFEAAKRKLIKEETRQKEDLVEKFWAIEEKKTTYNNQIKLKYLQILEKIKKIHEFHKAEIEDLYSQDLKLEKKFEREREIINNFQSKVIHLIVEMKMLDGEHLGEDPNANYTKVYKELAIEELRQKLDGFYEGQAITDEENRQFLRDLIGIDLAEDSADAGSYHYIDRHVNRVKAQNDIKIKLEQPKSKFDPYAPQGSTTAHSPEFEAGNFTTKTEGTFKTVDSQIEASIGLHFIQVGSHAPSEFFSKKAKLSGHKHEASYRAFLNMDQHIQKIRGEIIESVLGQVPNIGLTPQEFKYFCSFLTYEISAVIYRKNIEGKSLDKDEILGEVLISFLQTEIAKIAKSPVNLDASDIKTFASNIQNSFKEEPNKSFDTAVDNFFDGNGNTAKHAQEKLGNNKDQFKKELKDNIGKYFKKEIAEALQNKADTIININNFHSHLITARGIGSFESNQRLQFNSSRIAQYATQDENRGCTYMSNAIDWGKTHIIDGFDGSLVGNNAVAMVEVYKKLEQTHHFKIRNEERPLTLQGQTYDDYKNSLKEVRRLSKKYMLAIETDYMPTSIEYERCTAKLNRDKQTLNQLEAFRKAPENKDLVSDEKIRTLKNEIKKQESEIKDLKSKLKIEDKQLEISRDKIKQEEAKLHQFARKLNKEIKQKVSQNKGEIHKLKDYPEDPDGSKKQRYVAWVAFQKAQELFTESKWGNWGYRSKWKLARYNGMMQALMVFCAENSEKFASVACKSNNDRALLLALMLAILADKLIKLKSSEEFKLDDAAIKDILKTAQQALQWWNVNNELTALDRSGGPKTREDIFNLASEIYKEYKASPEPGVEISKLEKIGKLAAHKRTKPTKDFDDSLAKRMLQYPEDKDIYTFSCQIFGSGFSKPLQRLLAPGLSLKEKAEKYKYFLLDLAKKKGRDTQILRNSIYKRLFDLKARIAADTQPQKDVTQTPHYKQLKAFLTLTKELIKARKDPKGGDGGTGCKMITEILEEFDPNKKYHISDLSNFFLAIQNKVSLVRDNDWTDYYAGKFDSLRQKEGRVGKWVADHLDFWTKDRPLWLRELYHNFSKAKLSEDGFSFENIIQTQRVNGSNHLYNRVNELLNGEVNLAFLQYKQAMQPEAPIAAAQPQVVA